MLGIYPLCFRAIIKRTFLLTLIRSIRLHITHELLTLPQCSLTTVATDSTPHRGRLRTTVHPWKQLQMWNMFVKLNSTNKSDFFFTLTWRVRHGVSRADVFPLFFYPFHPTEKIFRSLWNPILLTTRGSNIRGSCLRFLEDISLSSKILFQYGLTVMESSR